MRLLGGSKKRTNTTVVTLDKYGRVLLPKRLRDALKLEPGDDLELQFDGKRLVLRMSPKRPPLRRENGVWVFRAGGKLAAAETNRVLRDGRSVNLPETTSG